MTVPLSLIESVALTRGGWIVLVACIVGAVLVIYAIYWMVFKMGKD